MKRFLFLPLFLLLSSCTGIPNGVQAINNFQLERYLGTWYEIARMDHRFERGLEQVTATYSLREDGGVRVLNRGFDTDKGKWKEAEGKAYLLGEDNEGRLKVSFFGPFYAAYNIIELDEDYQYVMISGHTRNYFWILSRSAEIDEQVLQRLITRASELGFATNQLIYVKQ